MTIELPGYKVEIPNQVYLRDTKISTPNKENLLKLKSVIMLSRFRQPTKEEVIELLIKKANAILPHMHRFNDPDYASQLTGIDAAFTFFNRESIEKLANRNAASIDEIANCSFAQPASKAEKNSFVYINYGLIPSMMIDFARNKFGRLRREWYHSKFNDTELLDHSIGERFGMALLVENGMLLPKNETDILLKRTTSLSDALFTNNSYYDPEEAKTVIGIIYSGLDSPEKISELEDSSEIAVENDAIRTLNNTYNHLILQNEPCPMEEEKLSTGNDVLLN